ncbi:MAG: hypothetical protein P8X55_05170 [Desulfosarcinaceae bacterium]
MLALLLLPGVPGRSTAFADDAVTFTLETQASYLLGPGDSKALARKLALFRAKRKAAEQAADTFADRRLIQFIDRDKTELVLLTTDSLHSEVLQAQFSESDQQTVFRVRLKTTVKLSDFIDAQLTSLRLGAKEAGEDYHDEMEPRIPAHLNPGHSLARAYRLFDKQEWRPAIIYLDRLASQYPHWREVDEIKAIARRCQNP